VAPSADELEREKARQRTYDTMARKARAGHVTGGRCFGYRYVEVTEPGVGRAGFGRIMSGLICPPGVAFPKGLVGRT
jgi:hypothetical protein